MKPSVILFFDIVGVLILAVNSAAECRSGHSEVTDIRAERTVYEWKINNFHLLPQLKGEAMYSQWFYSGNCTEKWRLLLYPRGHMETNDHVSVFLARDSPGKAPIKIYYEVKIIKSHVMIGNQSFTRKYDSQANWGWREFIKRSKVLSSNSSNSFDHNEVIIHCTIHSPLEIVTSTFDSTIFDLQGTTLIEDFRLLFKEPTLSDFTIIVGDKEFPTHKVVLATRSIVFAAMFDRNMTGDNPKSELRIENMDPAVVNGMLEFIYTDRVSGIKDFASELLVMADRYELDGLKSRCEKTLFEVMTYENAIDILLLAERYRANLLKKCVISYIVEHPREVVESENFKKAELNSKLLKELMIGLIQ